MNKTRALFKKGIKRKKSNTQSPPELSSTPTGSPIITSVNRRVSDMPVSLSVHMSPRRESAPIPLMPNTPTTEAWANNKLPSSGTGTASASTVPKVSVGFVDDGQALRVREGVIGITKDVQKFVATISELRQAMEELDAQPSISTPRINILSNDDEGDEEDEHDGGDNEVKRVLTPDDESEDEIMDDEEERHKEDNVIEKLKELAEVVEVCLQSNPGMQSTVLINASKDLLKTYKSCVHDNSKVSDCPHCTKAMDNLVDTFTQCVSDYLNGENTMLDFPINFGSMTQGGGGMVSGSGLGEGMGGSNRSKQLAVQPKSSMGFSKSYDNLAMFSSNLDISQAHDPVVDRIDQALASIENPVSAASSYIKLRQKYHRELVGYLNKRAQLEQKYYSQLGRIVKQTQSVVTELEHHQDHLPLINVFRQSLEDDSRYAMNSNTTFNLQVSHKILEPLERQIQECEKSRKILMNNWVRESKKVVEARTAMKNSKAKYELFGQELVRIKNLLGNEPVGPKADKRKKEISELETKWQESEVAYKEAVAHCNDCQYQVHEMAQKSILCAFRRIIINFDTALKSGLENYFSLQHNFFQSLPDPLLKDIQDTKDYEVGSEFLNFIAQQRQTTDELEDYHFEEFDPESDLWDIQEESGGPGNKMNSDLSRSTLVLSTAGTSSDTKTGIERAVSPTPVDHRGSGNYLLRNETPSPRPDNTRRNRPKSMALLDTITSVSSPNFFNDSPKNTLQRRNSEKGKDGTSISPPSSVQTAEEIVYSKMAKTHMLKKLRTPSRCRACDTYVYFHGFDCEICGLACHRKCLATLAIRCGSKKLPRKMNVFGINFHEHLKATKRMIPIIVTKCINEIDNRGLDTQGLYRISSAKSKMEKLCQLFESGSERVDLSDLPPHLISSCLKLYFRQLPEPLLTFDMYQEFLTFAREASMLLPCDLTTCSEERAGKAWELLHRLKGLIERLSSDSQLTLARLMYHLNRVSSPDHVRVNCMPASNLGIVFGPNLLRQKEMIPSLALLANMSLQAKAVEIMVAHATEVFVIPEEQIIQLEVESSEENEVAPNERPIDIEDNSVMEIKSDINDTKTPVSTPPERRKQNVEELHEAIEGFTNGSLLSPVSHRSRTHLLPSPVTASPLLKDSRDWQEPGDRNTLPGCIEDNFAESMINSFDKKLIPVRPHSCTIEKVLTPVMEMKDDAQPGDISSEEDTEIEILEATVNSTLERHSRRRTQSFTKSTSTGFGEESDSIAESDVFHSRTASLTSSTGADNGLYVVRSEDNLLQHSNKQGEPESGDLLNQKQGSSDSNDSYHPFESPDVQALLKPSKPHPLSLPHTYPRPSKAPTLPTRQMSEGEIKPMKATFSLGSPPYDSPVSFRSIDKSTSIASSQGSFSEGIVEDVSPVSDYLSSKQQRNGKNENEEESRLSDDLPMDNKCLSPKKQHSKEKEATTRSSNCGYDLPLPDDSPITVGNPKLLRNHHHKHSLSRDSGLSDSPDPFVDLASSPSHGINSHVLTDKLTQMTKVQLSPLVNRNQVADSTSDTTKKFQELLQNTTPNTKPCRPRKLTKNTIRVMKITPSFDSMESSSAEGVEAEQISRIQRLRMASPDELVSPSEKQLGFASIRRSISHGEVLKSQEQEEEDEEVSAVSMLEGGVRLLDKLIVSKANNTSSSRTDQRKVSRSLENILSNY